MKNFINLFFRNRKLFIFLLLIIPAVAFSQPDILLDPLFKNNSDSWKVKTKQKGFAQYKPAEVSFGQVRTIKTDAEKPQELSRDVRRDLFWKDIKTVNKRESSLVLTFNDTDTIVVNMLATTVDDVHKRNTTGVIFNADKNEDEKASFQSWINEMIIRFQSDTVQWHYIKTDSADFSLCGCVGKLESPSDSFLVKPIDNLSGKKMKDILLAQPATGFIFFHEEKQVAALQLIMKRNAWISKDITPPAMQAIFATMTALFATIKAENGNGF
ncbi:MAG: hypothetical protein ABUT20_44420 [Bacteroidota bacterium]